MYHKHALCFALSDATQRLLLGWERRVQCHNWRIASHPYFLWGMRSTINCLVWISNPWQIVYVSSRMIVRFRGHIVRRHRQGCSFNWVVVPFVSHLGLQCFCHVSVVNCCHSVCSSPRKLVHWLKKEGGNKMMKCYYVITICIVCLLSCSMDSQCQFQIKMLTRGCL